MLPCWLVANISPASPAGDKGRPFYLPVCRAPSIGGVAMSFGDFFVLAGFGALVGFALIGLHRVLVVFGGGR